MTRQRPWKRREFLSALGVAGGSLVLPLMGSRTALGDGGTLPKRIVFFVSTHQIVGDAWQMLRGNPDMEAFEYAFDDPDPGSFSEILEPLHPFRDKLLCLDGLSYLSGVWNQAAVGNGHNISHLSALTGAEILSNTSVAGPSVDQIIAQQVAVPGRIPSLELSTEDASHLYIGGFVNLGPGARAPVETSPQALFHRLFSSNAGGIEEPTNADLVAAERTAVLDFLQHEYAQMAPRIGGEDRGKLEHHRDLIVDLGEQLEGLAELVCEEPQGSWGDAELGPMQKFSQLAMLTASAFACDITRVVTLQVGQLPNPVFDAPPGDVHQDIAHAAAAQPRKDQMIQYNRVHAEMFAELLGLLDSYPEGNGTMLDNTVVVWLPEHGYRKFRDQSGQLVWDFGAAHGQLDVPVVLAGSCGGALQTGRYVSYGRQPIDLQFEPAMTGPGHNRLLVSLCQAMGVDLDTVGLTERTIGGQAFDLTGPLPGLA